MTDALVVEGVGKDYLLGEDTRGLLSEMIVTKVRRRRDAPARRELLRALDDVTFTIPAGTAVGIVGRNGAGKSTLLKLISRITAPTRGRFELYGRLGSLLEVGSGFHPELTGRENTYLNGSLLGMRRAEITRKFDEIVAFSELERFIDTPVKRYSSGMYVRLAFAVAAHLEPEILVVDEVLAVGDVVFQRKCLGKMDDVASGGRTVLFVSHSTAAIRQLTTRSLLLDVGRLVADGPTDEVLEAYMATAGGDRRLVDTSQLPRVDAQYGVTARIQRACLVAPPAGVLDWNDDVQFDVDVYAAEDIDGLRIGAAVIRFDGSPVGAGFGPCLPHVAAGTTTRFHLRFAGGLLAPGSYYLGLSAGWGDARSGFRDFDVVMESVHFEVAAETGASGGVAAWSPNWGSVRLPEIVLDRAEVV